MAKSMGALTTGAVSEAGTHGVVTYVGAIGGTVTLRETDGSGRVLADLTTGQHVTFSDPVAYKDGLHITVSAGSGYVHVA